MFTVKARDPQDAEMAEFLDKIIKPFTQHWVDETEKQMHNVLLYGTAHPQTIEFSQPCDPQSWTDTKRYQKEIFRMKPGPYKSSTHGQIPLSLRGRELLQNMREAVVGGLAAVARGELSPYTPESRIAYTRGELAKYMSELEAKCDAIKVEELRRGYGGGVGKPFMERYPFYTFGIDMCGIDMCGDQLDETALAKINLKETPVKNDIETPQKDPTPKSRSELIGEATHELVQAQRELEYILKDAATKPEQMYINDKHTGSYMRGAVAELVKEQWGTLAKKAVARAKARVSKAEKAVAALLA